MNRNIAKTIQSFTKFLFLSIMLHLAFCATSYALWYVVKTISLSSNKLQKGEILTTTVEFIPSQSARENPSPALSIEKRVSPQRKQQTSRNNAREKANKKSLQTHAGSTLSDIIADPKNKPPVYPEEARLIGKEALCILKISIAQNGSVHKIVLQNDTNHCPAVFLREAKKAISKWQFSTHNAKCIERSVPINFRLNS